jgi:hypothetical protein
MEPVPYRDAEHRFLRESGRKLEINADLETL